MLFPYTYVPHQIERMQEFIDFIFFEVWCKAPGNAPFDLGLFTKMPDLQEVMQAFYYSDAKGADFFYGHVEYIYGLFAKLTPQQISQLQSWYYGNNDVEKVCAHDPQAHSVRYKNVLVTYPALGKALAKFFKGLYDKSLLELAALKAKIGDLNDHYQKFFTENNQGKCPFCGLNHLKGIHHTRREAYDHYLPKSRYPFNAINFKNLAPACNECNSAYKLSRDPVNNIDGHRRKAFYPYATQSYAIAVHVALLNSDLVNLKPTEITLQFGPAVISEEIDSWRDVYGIDERYKAEFCEKNSGKYWLAQVLDEWKEDGKPPSAFLITLARQAGKSPYAECNFLKKPFLDACNRIGIFDCS